MINCLCFVSFVYQTTKVVQSNRNIKFKQTKVRPILIFSYADAKGASVAFGPYGRRTLFATTGGLSPQRSPLPRATSTQDRRRGALASVATKGRFIAPRGVCRSHQHERHPRKADAFHLSDKQFAVHGCTHSGHAAHHPDRACDGGEYGD